jgi:hypothetical protein
MYYSCSDSEVMDMICVFKDEELLRLNEEKEMLEEQILKAQAEEDPQEEAVKRAVLGQVEDQV